jgi:hypothetical protein
MSFTLSDDITSWRVTAHGISKDGCAGVSSDVVVSTLPFYIDAVMADEFIAGDDFAVLVKSYGWLYKFNGTDVDYRFEVVKDGKTVYEDAKTSATFAYFNAGKLPEGEYAIRVWGDLKKGMGVSGVSGVSGESGVSGGSGGSGSNASKSASNAAEYRDGVERAVRVARDGILLPLYETQTLTENAPRLAPINVESSPVKVTMHNAEIKPIMGIMTSCMSYNSERTDYMAATEFGRYFIYTLRGKDDVSDYVSGARNIVPEYGGIPELPSGDADFYYTARFAAAFPELVDNRTIRDYVRNGQWLGANAPESAFDEAETNRAAGFFALAALREPVLLDIGMQLDIIYGDADQTKFSNRYNAHMRVLYYAAALCALGDDAAARALIEKYRASDRMTSEIHESALEYIDTLMLYINTTVDPEKAFEYLTEKKDNIYVSDVCEKVNFIKRAVTLGGVASEVSYSLNGGTKTEKLRNFDMITLVMTREQYENLNLTNLRGSTDVSISFNGFADNLDPYESKIQLIKTVTESKIYIKVIMPKDAPAGWYTVKDRIPSNMRFIKTKSKREVYGWSDHFVRGQKQSVDICIIYDGYNDVTAEYEVAKISDADAVKGTAYASMNFDTGQIWGKSE